jgi:hypothetical protein
LHGRRGEPAGHDAAGLRPADQARIGQDVEMLHDRRKRHGKRARELAHRNVLVLDELRQQRPPRRVGEGGKGSVERGVLTLNHMVKCMINGSLLSIAPFARIVRVEKGRNR